MFEDPAQPNAEPVAWRYMAHGRWSVTTIKGAAEFRQSEGCVVEPLYTASAIAQSDAETKQDVREALEAIELVVSYAYASDAADDLLPMSGQDVDRARIGLKTLRTALAQSNAGPVAGLDIDAAAKAGLATRNPAPHAAPSSYSNTKTVTIGPALAQPDAEQCPACGSPNPHIHPAMQADGGEVELCSDAFHLRETPQNRKEYIEAVKRKRAALAQSDAEPVAWRYAYPDYPDHWNVTSDKLTADERQGNAGCIIEPLYTTTPRPDASAGLLEAAEHWAKQAEYSEHAAQTLNSSHLVSKSKGIAQGYREVEQYLRARAADRSGK